MKTCGKPIEVYVEINRDMYKVQRPTRVVKQKSAIEIDVVGTTGVKTFLLKDGVPVFHTLEDLLKWGWVTPAGWFDNGLLVLKFWHKNRKYMQRLGVYSPRSVFLRPGSMPRKMELHWKMGEVEAVATLGEEGIEIMELVNIKRPDATVWQMFPVGTTVWPVGLKFFTDLGLLYDQTGEKHGRE